MPASRLSDAAVFNRTVEDDPSGLLLTGLAARQGENFTPCRGNSPIKGRAESISRLLTLSITLAVESYRYRQGRLSRLGDRPKSGPSRLRSDWLHSAACRSWV